MKGTNSHLQEYYRYIASSQQINHPPSDWEMQKKKFIEIIDAEDNSISIIIITMTKL